MSKHGSEVWNLWLERAKPLIPVIVINDIAEAIPLAQSLVAGGVRFMEITLRTPLGLDAIRIIKETVPDAIVGAGTVTNSKQFEAVLQQGAEFVVSPGLDADLLRAAQEWGGPYLPGVATASEVMQARNAGFRFQKLFPAQVVGGVQALKAFSGPFYDVKFCPTGGIGQHNYQEFLAAHNVFAVGGSWLAPKELVATHNWQAITGLAISS